MSDIITILNGSSQTTLNDYNFILTDKSFILSAAEHVNAQLDSLGLKTQFFSERQPAFYNHENLQELEESCCINGLAVIIERKTSEVAQTFVTAIEKAAASNKPMPFNGPKYGISSLLTARTSDLAERPTVDIVLHHTDFFTSRVTSEVLKEIVKDNPETFSEDAMRTLPQFDGRNLGFLFNALGINASVVTSDNQYVVGHRPNGARLVAMNVGLRPVEDEPATGPDLPGLFNRGMKEELGMTGIPPETVWLREIFYVQTQAQLGLHVLVKTDKTFEEIKRLHPLEQDSYENLRIAGFPYNPATMAAMADDMLVPTIDYTRDLWRNLALQNCP